MKHGFGQRFPIAVMWKGLKIIVVITIIMLTKSTCFGELKSDLLHGLPVERLARVWPRGDLKEFQACSFSHHWRPPAGRGVGGTGTGTSRLQPHVARLPSEAKHLLEAKHLWKSSTFGSEAAAEAEAMSGQGPAVPGPGDTVTGAILSCILLALLPEPGAAPQPRARLCPQLSSCFEGYKLVLEVTKALRTNRATPQSKSVTTRV